MANLATTAVNAIPPNPPSAWYKNMDWDGVGRFAKNAGKIGLGAAALYGGTRYIASPIIGSMVDPELKEKIGESRLGNFLLGWNPDSPNLQEAILEKKERENYDKALARMEEQRAINEQAYRDRIKFNVETAYNKAADLGQLELGLGGVKAARDLYADVLGNEVHYYMQSLADANNAVNTILGYRANPI